MLDYENHVADRYHSENVGTLKLVYAKFRNLNEFRIQTEVSQKSKIITVELLEEYRTWNPDHFEFGGWFDGGSATGLNLTKRANTSFCVYTATQAELVGAVTMDLCYVVFVAFVLHLHLFVEAFAARDVELVNATVGHLQREQCNLFAGEWICKSCRTGLHE
uniref:Uncharacterized protein n=1 Tax=Ananas comosus var. bracteatus TaxID=296719 RepID=A0A6V7PTK2_ANACO|nr:unnamed protein product [Ananas comosus var. bracteatus]